MNYYNDTKIGVLTYDVRHRKTYDILCLLKVSGYKKVTVYAMPLQYKKTFQPLLQHRPEMNWAIDTVEICHQFSFKYHLIQKYTDIIRESDDEIMLVGGAAILPAEFIDRYRIINAHPGYIPNCRGLDAYKWAIYEKQPVGVTSHLIGEEVDAGEVIIREKVPIFQHDTFYSLAQRVYESEVRVLVQSIPHIIADEKRIYISGSGYSVHKRMPRKVENELLQKFEEYKSGVLNNGISRFEEAVPFT